MYIVLRENEDYLNVKHVLLKQQQHNSSKFNTRTCTNTDTATGLYKSSPAKNGWKTNANAE